MAEMMINGDNLIKYCMERRCGSVPIERIKSEPRIEVERVRHARWIFVGEETMHDGWTYRKHKCTECDFVTVEAKNFCQNCGARMDGGGDLV